MARWCAVKGCAQKKRIKKGDSLYKLPAVIRHSDAAARKMSERRRIKWLARINRKDLSPNQLCESRSTLSVCSRHFVSGKPSGLFDDKSPDWAPSLYLGNGRDGDGDKDDNNVKGEPDPPIELDMDCVPANPLPVYDEADCVTNVVEFSKQKAKLERCITKLKNLVSQRDTLIRKLECLQILADIDIDLLCRTINIAMHPEAKEDWDKLYCLVMTINGEDEIQNLIGDEDAEISDIDEDGNDDKNNLDRRRKVHKRKNHVKACHRSVAIQCQERKKEVETMGIQTDVNIFTHLPDLMPKNKEQVYLVLDYGKEGQGSVVKVAASGDSPEKQMQSVNMTDSDSTSTSPLRSAEEGLMKTPGINEEIDTVLPMREGTHQSTKAHIPNIGQSIQHQQQSTNTISATPYSKDMPLSKTLMSDIVPEINIPDFSTGPMDMLPITEEPEEVNHQSTAQQELMSESETSQESTTNPLQIKNYVPRQHRGVYERKVVIKKIQHPFLVQSPQNSTALVMSNSNRGGQSKVFKRETICKICGKVFPSMMDQMLHARIEHLGKKVFECEVCRKKFSFNNDRRRHMIMHTKQKNYQCAECGKTYVSHPGLVSHIESVHKGVRHRCEICGQVYIRKSSLRIHMAERHSEKKQETISPVVEYNMQPPTNLMDLDQQMATYSGNLLQNSGMMGQDRSNFVSF